jgi:hypothetical protein
LCYVCLSVCLSVSPHVSTHKRCSNFHTVFIWTVCHRTLSYTCALFFYSRQSDASETVGTTTVTTKTTWKRL